MSVTKEQQMSGVVENKYTFVKQMGAGPKFDNMPRLGSEKKEVEDPVEHVICTEKSSGFMARLSEIDDKLILLTKNGSDPRYIATAKRILQAQMSAKLLAALLLFLKEWGWSLNLEVISKCIDSVEVEMEDDAKGEACGSTIIKKKVIKYGEVCAHGSIPKTDHVIIHGGSQQNSLTLTPIDLMMMKETLCSILVAHFREESALKEETEDEILTAEERAREELRGSLFLASCFGFKTDERGITPLQVAFDAVNNRMLCPCIRKVAPCAALDTLPPDTPYVAEGDEYYYLSNGLLAELAKQYANDTSNSRWRYKDHSTGAVDSKECFEGYVVHKVRKSDLENPSWSWRLLNTFKNPRTGHFDPSMVSPLEKKSGDLQLKEKAVEFVSGFYQIQNDSGKLTLENFLPSTGGELQKFIWHLLGFVESPEGRVCNASKENSFKLVLTGSDQLPPGYAVLTVSVNGDDNIFYQFEKFYHQHQQTHKSLLRLSRGCSFIISTSGVVEEAAALLDYVDRVPTDNRTKMKHANYTSRTMCQRAKFEKMCDSSLQEADMAVVGAVAKKDCKCDAPNNTVNIGCMFEEALRYASRWGVYGEAARSELLKKEYLIAAYIAAYTRTGRKYKTYLYAINDMMEDLRLGGHAELACAWLDQLMTVVSSHCSLQDQQQLVSKQVTELLVALEPRQVFALAVYALQEPESEALQALVDVIAIGFSCVHIGSSCANVACSKGFLFKELKNNSIANELKDVLLPLLALVRDYGVAWLRKHSKPPRVLKLVMVAATPGAGKSTWLAELRVKIESGFLGDSHQCIIVASDAIPRNIRNRNEALMQQIKEAAEKMESSSSYVLIDRCCIDLFRAGNGFLNMLRSLSFEFRLDIQYFIPEHGKVSLNGNEKDWVLPFSEAQMCVNAATVLYRAQHAGGVEGANGVRVAMEHMKNARLPVNYGLPVLVQHALEGIAYSLKISFFQYIFPFDGVQLKVPEEILMAMRLALGLELSMEAQLAVVALAEKKTKEAATTQKRTKPSKKGEGGAEGEVVIASRQMILSKLVDGLLQNFSGPDRGDLVDEATYSMLQTLHYRLLTVIKSADSGSDDSTMMMAMEGVWNEYLDSLKTSGKIVENFLDSARLPVGRVVNQMVTAMIVQDAPLSLPFSFKSNSDSSMILRNVPVIPTYYALVSPQFGKIDWKQVRGGEEPVYVRSDIHNLHITMNMPLFQKKDFSMKGGGGSAEDYNYISRDIKNAIKGEVFTVKVESVGVSCTSNVAMVSVVDMAGDCLEQKHITLLCAGSNKDSVSKVTAAALFKKNDLMRDDPSNKIEISCCFVAKFPTPPVLVRW